MEAPRNANGPVLQAALNGTKGATSIEYGVIAALIAVAIITGLLTLQGSVKWVHRPGVINHPVSWV